MPNLDGFETCKRIKARPALADIPLMFLTRLESAADEEHGFSLGAEEFINKRFSSPVVLARVRTHLQLAQAGRDLRARNEELERQVAERTRGVVEKSRELVTRTEQLSLAQATVIAAFCTLAEARDNETGNHIRRTQNYMRRLAEKLAGNRAFGRSSVKRTSC